MEISKLLNNSLVVFVLLVSAMTIIYIYSVTLWTTLFSITVSWVLTDFIFSFLIAGGSGIFQFRPFSTQTLYKGKAYLVFFAMIVGSTYVSSLLIDTFLKSVLTSQDVMEILSLSIPRPIIVTNLMAGVAVFLDLNARFYQREKQQI